MKEFNQHILPYPLRPLALMIACCFSQFAIANTDVPANTRMGSWLVDLQNQPPSDLPKNGFYPEATRWYSQTEIAPQTVERQQLLDSLLALSHHHATIQKLATWAESLPATGRVILPSADGRFLQANPSIEPVLQEGDSVQVFQRQDRIAILLDDASICYANYLPSAETKTYVNQCLNLLNIRQNFDDAYLILPNGQVEKVSIANWNAHQQITPQPNSWIWLPNPKHGWSEHLALRFAKFLATQSIHLPTPKDGQILQAKIDQEQLEQQKPSRDLPVSPSDWGGVGLLQTPTARMNPEGTVGFGMTMVKPYTHYNLTLQPFENLETTFRYTNTDGKTYGPISPNQSHKDKSLDVKLRLLKESRFLPEVAVGWRDPLGTNLFSGEYLVGSKRYGDFDFSLGLGWGYLGKREDFNNPLNKLHPHFSNERKYGTGKYGGKVNPKNWFTGKTSLFGGVQWHSPYQPLTVKLEYDGNNYQPESEPQTSYKFSQTSPINVGATWQGRHFDASIGLERGKEWMFGLNLHTDVANLGREKIFANAYHDVRLSHHVSNFLNSGLSYRFDFHKNQPAKNDFEKLLQQFSQATGWQAFQLRQQDHVWLIDAHFDQGVYLKDRLNQGLKLLTQYAPEYVKHFSVTLFQHNVPINRFDINRQDWLAQHSQLLPPSLQKTDLIQIQPPFHRSNSILVLAYNPKI